MAVKWILSVGELTLGVGVGDKMSLLLCLWFIRMQSVTLTLARAAASAKAVHPQDKTTAMDHTSVAVLAEEMTFTH